MVGAPGFEPGTSCAQGRRKAPPNPPAFSQQLENPILSRHLRMCLDVSGCGRKFVGSLQKALQGLREVTAKATIASSATVAQVGYSFGTHSLSKLFFLALLLVGGAFLYPQQVNAQFSVPVPYCQQDGSNSTPSTTQVCTGPITSCPPTTQVLFSSSLALGTLPYPSLRFQL